ncbi:MAG: phenol hydroxylase subunit P4 [Gammaproteobacteria bacterium]
MSVIALAAGYSGEMKDAVERYRGQMLLSVGWDEHLCYPPLCMSVSPEMPFKALIAEVLAGMFAQHPDASKIDWLNVEWKSSGLAFKPDHERSLHDNGLGHKSVLRFRTPGLGGYEGKGI